MWTQVLSQWNSHRYVFEKTIDVDTAYQYRVSSSKNITVYESTPTFQQLLGQMRIVLVKNLILYQSFSYYSKVERGCQHINLECGIEK